MSSSNEHNIIIFPGGRPEHKDDIEEDQSQIFDPDPISLAELMEQGVITTQQIMIQHFDAQERAMLEVIDKMRELGELLQKGKRVGKKNSSNSG